MYIDREYITVLWVATLIFGENKMTSRTQISTKCLALSWWFIQTFDLKILLPGFIMQCQILIKDHYIRCLDAVFAAKHGEPSLSLLRTHWSRVFLALTPGYVSVDCRASQSSVRSQAGPQELEVSRRTAASHYGTQGHTWLIHSNLFRMTLFSTKVLKKYPSKFAIESEP